MAQTLGNLLDRIEDDNRQIAEVVTFGHLYPKVNKAHYGYIIFAEGAYGEQMIIESNFPTVNSSPWFYEDMCEFISNYIDEHSKTDYGVYKFIGSYKNKKNGEAIFMGETHKIYL